MIDWTRHDDHVLSPCGTYKVLNYDKSKKRKDRFCLYSRDHSGRGHEHVKELKNVYCNLLFMGTFQDCTDFAEELRRNDEKLVLHTDAIKTGTGS